MYPNITWSMSKQSILVGTMSQKRDFLGIHKGDTVKRLSKKSKETIGIGKSRMKRNMDKIMKELESKCERGNLVRVSDSAALKEKKNDSLSDTIRRFHAGFLTNTRDPTVNKKVVKDEMDSEGQKSSRSELMGVCGST